jgi:hypothetical protein
MGSNEATDDSRTAGAQAAWRLRVYPVAIIVGLIAAVAFGAVAAGSSDAPADTVGGDFAAFYGAGQIAADGDWDLLYELDRQLDVQAGLHSEEDGDVARFFAYPPQVAQVYQPFGALDYHWSYLLHTLLMGAFLWGAVLLARPMIPWLQGRVALAVSASLLFWPMFRTVTGGSNTAFTLFLIVAAWRLIHEDRQLAAGLVLAGLSYKPQFVVPLVGLFLLGRYWRVVIGAVGGGVIFYLWGVALQGWGWASAWLEMASNFGSLDAEVNGHSSISIIGFAENLFGVGLSPGVAVAWALAGLTALFLSWLWWRGDQADLPLLLAIAMPGILLVSLHAMSHDGALVVLTVAIVVGVSGPRDWLPWVVVIWLLGASQLMIRQLGFSPGFPMLLIVLYWAWLVTPVRQQRAVSRPGAAMPT